MRVIQAFECRVVSTRRQPRQLHLTVAIVGDELKSSCHSVSMTPAEPKTRNRLEMRILCGNCEVTLDVYAANCRFYRMIDEMDRRILSLLQQDARLPNA